MSARQERPNGRGWAVLAATIAVAALAGCTSARLVNVWRDPGYRKAPMHRVLIVSQRDDPVVRRLWEDAVRARLTAQGVDATSSYEQFPSAPPSKSDVQLALRDGDLDGALIFKPLGGTTDTRWVPGYTTLEPRQYYDPWSSRSGFVYRERWHRGYHVTDYYDREQVTLWTPQDGGQMVWAGTVEVANPSSQDEFRRDLADGLVPGMKRAGLI